MLKSVKEIVARTADLRADTTSKQVAVPSRADILADKLDRELDRERSTPEIQRRLMKAEGYDQLRSIAADIRDAAIRGDLKLTLGDRLRLLLAERSASNWSGMMSFAKWMAAQAPEGQRLFTDTPEIGQQYAMALNRRGGLYNSVLAEGILAKIVDHGGGNSETFGILGRIYKDRWLKLRAVDPRNGNLLCALNAYWSGVKCNPRELYPAINVLTLLRIAGEHEALSGFAKYIEGLTRERSEKDYFNYATRVELFAAMGQIEAAQAEAISAVSRAQDPWELETTARTLSLISTAGAENNVLARTRKLEQELESAYAELEIQKERRDWGLAGQLAYERIPDLEGRLEKEAETAGRPEVIKLAGFLRDSAHQKAFVARAVASAA